MVLCTHNEWLINASEIYMKKNNGKNTTHHFSVLQEPIASERDFKKNPSAPPSIPPWGSPIGYYHIRVVSYHECKRDGSCCVCREEMLWREELRTARAKIYMNTGHRVARAVATYQGRLTLLRMQSLMQLGGNELVDRLGRLGSSALPRWQPTPHQTTPCPSNIH